MKVCCTSYHILFLCIGRIIVYTGQIIHNNMNNTTILDALLMEENYAIDSLYDSYMTNTLVHQLYEVYMNKNM